MIEVPLYGPHRNGTLEGAPIDEHVLRFATASLLGETYRGTSLIRKRNPVGPYMYSRTMPRVLGGS